MKEKESRDTDRIRGLGRVFQRGETWWIAYYAPKAGRRVEVRETSGSRNRKAAEKLLKLRLKETGAADLGLRPFIGPQQDRLTVDELLDALESDYRLRGKCSPQVVSRLKPLRDFFSGRRASAVDEKLIDGYVRQRLNREPRDPGRGKRNRKPKTVNNEVQLLAQAFAKAVRERKLASAPVVRRLPVQNVRTGFFEHSDLQALLVHLPEYLRGFCRFAHLAGWRKGEIASLT